jgi:hypothetical protein
MDILFKKNKHYISLNTAWLAYLIRLIQLTKVEQMLIISSP